LSRWHHRHRLIRDQSGTTTIVDDIHFQTPLALVDFLFYPVMWLMFAYRKPIYRRIFK
jgi:ligand-binding SRPBCC domain-containing protein